MLLPMVFETNRHTELTARARALPTAPLLDFDFLRLATLTILKAWQFWLD